MEPTFKPGQLVVATSLTKATPGDVVVLRHQGIEKIKRIQRVENDQVFVVGDNPAESTDSRQLGFLPRRVIVAKVIWPRRAGR
ncbi:MAG TPA: S26 family signal peptidase [Candidatus Saccharimonadales bacterium]|nr:S26 family signal peptidase [Candidatus Saccharimonadales bacterium]